MRVILADDHPVYRDGLRLLLEELDVQVVGEAEDGAAAVELTGQLRPDVVIMDLHMPELNGVDATRQITATHPDVAVLVLTMIDDESTLLAALRAGARGYLLKGAGHDDVRRALAAVDSGDTVLAGPVARRLRQILAQQSVQRPFPQLSDRETEILELLARGRSNEQIAATLFLSVKTIRNYVSAVFAKLGVNSRAAAVAAARDAGLGQPR